jgi:hypothetical protein
MKLAELKEKIYELNLKEFDGMHLGSGTILDAQKFVQNHITFLESNPNNSTFLLYYNRLFEFYNKTQNNEM